MECDVVVTGILVGSAESDALLVLLVEVSEAGDFDLREAACSRELGWEVSFVEGVAVFEGSGSSTVGCLWPFVVDFSSGSCCGVPSMSDIGFSASADRESWYQGQTR